MQLYLTTHAEVHVSERGKYLNDLEFVNISLCQFDLFDLFVSRVSFLRCQTFSFFSNVHSRSQEGWPPRHTSTRTKMIGAF